ncbi:VWFA and cache domain-containing protein CG16868 [Plutella xylostella]|uniref:VWFA and cache domain-containing protein CG16868 n=1 Tax=Plutella xylostella TaxID=51655 RepID=UPI002032487E|nr:VWFA and cache domain-containing protein CG16868 [Plutella xylostella]
MKQLLALFILVLYKVNAQSDNCTADDYRCENKRMVLKLAQDLGSTFRELVQQELGAEFAAQFEAKPQHKASPEPTDEEILSSISEKLANKLTSATNILKDLNSTLSNSNSSTYTTPCPYKGINKSTIFKNIDFHDNLTSTPPSVDLEDKDGANDIKIKRQYFLSHIDYATDKECTAMPQSNLRYLYHKIVNPDPKLVIFIIDNSVGEKAIQYTVNIVKEISHAMQASDVFALKITNISDFVKFEDSCSVGGFSDIGHATDSNKLKLKDYLMTIDNTQTSLPHSTINEELQMLLTKNQLPTHKLIVFLTDTKVLTDESWPKMFPYPIKEDDTIKLAIGVINEGSEDLSSSLEILHFDKWHNHSKSHSLMRVHINDSGVVGQVASAFISLMPQNYEKNQLMLMEPIWEATERDFIVSLVIPTSGGVLGVDMYWSDLAEDIIYFRQTTIERRAFVIDFAGTVIMHTHFPRPELTTEKIKFSKLKNIENFEFIDNVIGQMLTDSQGKLTKFDSLSNKTISYSWRWAARLYVACVVSEVAEAAAAPEPAFLTRRDSDILYHRLDLFPPRDGTLCRHFRQMATLDQGTVFLSPSSFVTPFAYLRGAGGGLGEPYLRNCLAYLRSVARGLLANPGLRDDVQRDAAALNALLAYYRRRQLSGPYARYVVRRYAASDSGVLAMFPGTLLEPEYEPVRRTWHAAARARPGRLQLAPPALDAGGAGYVVTLSWRAPPAVLAMDVPLGFLQRLLERLQPACGAPGLRCLLLDARGYLLAHPALLARGPAERLHVTHREPLLAVDLLLHRQLVTKRRCLAAHERATQRYYSFNTSLEHAVSNAVAGEHCLHYSVAAVPGADALVALVNASCSAGAFCPCSMLDRACLNCRRMEQAECECPCECAAPACGEAAGPAPAPCPAPAEAAAHKATHFHKFAEGLPACVDWACGELASRADCLGAVGCEWCAAQGEARSPLAAPYCAPQELCFGGVLGAVTPYGGGGNAPPAAHSALGPVVGCLVTAGLVCAVAAYCYRQGGAAAEEGAAPQYAGGDTWGSGSAPAAGAGASESGAGGAGRERLLPAPVSPYRVVSGVRRARAAGSDHGYSTMTPHEDSEATAPGGGDPAALSDDTRSEASCPLPRRAAPPAAPRAAPAPAPDTRVLAPVTVHRHMEALAELPPAPTV